MPRGSSTSQELGFIYSRLTNPTVMTLAERLAALEGGVGAVCTSSGHAAQIMALFPLMRPGDNIITSTRLYGGTVTQFTHTIRRFGWSARFADTEDLAGARGDGRRRDTRAIFCESIANPGGYVTDIPALAEVAKRLGVPLIVDNTSATPYLCRPIEQGADLVVHSTTKYLTGNGTVVGGAIIDCRALRLVRLGQVPEPDRARARLSRAEVPRDLRADGLHLPLHRHRAARPRHDHGAAERLPDAARHRDAEPPDEEARGERGGRRHLAGEGPAGRVRDLRRACRPRPGTSGRSGSIRTAPARSSPSR